MNILRTGLPEVGARFIEADYSGAILGLRKMLRRGNDNAIQHHYYSWQDVETFEFLATVGAPVLMEENAFIRGTAALTSSVEELAGTLSSFNRVLPESERLALFYQRLGAAKPANKAQEALDLLSKTLSEIEDVHSGVKAVAEPGLKYTGRMYPPRADFITELPGGALEALSKGERILFGADGSISIFSRKTGELIFSKPGAP
jgi:hypothetical protein